MRQRRAHRTGLQARTAGHRSIDASHCRRQGGNPFAGTHPPAARARHRGTALHAVATAAPHSGNPFLRAKTPGCRGCGCNQLKLLETLVRTPLANAQKQNAPGMSPRAFACPRKIGVADLPLEEDQLMSGSSSLRSPLRGRSAHASATCPRHAGRRAVEFAMWKECVMEIRCVAIRRDDEGCARYAANFCAASGFSDASKFPDERSRAQRKGIASPQLRQ